MTTQHTLGPWSVGQQKFSRHGVALEGNVHVIRMHGACGAAIYSMGCQPAETEATARLIAAAPDLLESLIELQAAYRKAVGLHGHEDDAFTVRSHNAIAKAKGESA